MASSCRQFGPGVGLLEGPPDVFRGKVCVYLGGGDIGMPQQLLDGPEVRSAAEHVSGETMSQRVRCDLTCQTGRFGVLLQDLPETLPGKSLAAVVQEQGAFIITP